MRKTQYKIIKRKEQVDTLISHCKTTRWCSLDFETKATGPDGPIISNKSKQPVGFQFDEDEPTLIAISFQPGSAWVVPLFHKDSPFKRGQVLRILHHLSREVFENPDIIKVAQNMKFEHKWLKRYGCDLKGRLFDTMLAKYILDEERPHGLKDIINLVYEDGEFDGYDDKVDVLKRKYGGWANIPLKPLAKYCAMDADLTLRIWIRFERKLIKNGLYNVFRNLLMQAHRVLVESEFHGMFIDVDYLDTIINEQGEKIEAKLIELHSHKRIAKFQKARVKEHKLNLIKAAKDEIDDIESGRKETKDPDRMIAAREAKVARYIAGEFTTNKEQISEVNFNSQPQMVSLLYDSPKGFQFDATDKTDSGAWSTGEETLLKLKNVDKSGFIQQLLDYRTLTKLYSTYMVGMKYRLGGNEYIHGSFLIHGTVTGRLSSRNPNLQNIPRDTTSSLIKKMFIAPKGYLILHLDYSQAELRVLAEVANEKTMQEWFRTGKDIHLASACKKWNFDYDTAKSIMDDEDNPDYVTWKKRRKQAKTINFGIVYEEGPKKLAEGLSEPGNVVTEEDAKDFLDEYFTQFPRIKKYINKKHREVEEEGQVSNLFGRVRRLPDIYERHSNYGAYLRAQRQSVNAPIQGTASDFALFSSVLIREAKLKGLLPADMPQVATVHDSLIFYIRPKDIHKAVPVLEKLCENPETKEWFGFEVKNVSMSVDFEIGKHWGKLPKYKKDIDYSKWLTI